MVRSLRDWMLGIVTAALTVHLGVDWLGHERQQKNLRCETLTVVDSRGRSRVVLNGNDMTSVVEVLDLAGTPRLTVGIEESGVESLVASAIRLTVLDHTGEPALELAEVGNSHHGRSARISIYGLDENGQAAGIGMLGTDPLNQWPHLEFGGGLGGWLYLGLATYGDPELSMRQSPTGPGESPFSIATRSPDDIGRFSLAPGSGVGNVVVGDRAVVTVPKEK